MSDQLWSMSQYVKRLREISSKDRHGWDKNVKTNIMYYKERSIKMVQIYP